MGYIMTAEELTAKAQAIAALPTAYIFGGIGEKITEEKLKQKNALYSKNATHVAKAQPLIGSGYMFDCVCLIKSILWGWTKENADAGKVPYNTSLVPDVNANGMITRCSNISFDFTDIVPGAAVWMNGHIGVYIGDGLAVECTPAFKRGVQITAVLNIGSKDGYSGRRWTKWGLLPWVDYSNAAVKIRVIFNGEEYYLPGRFNNGTNYISGSVREIFGALGAEITAQDTTPVIKL